MRISEHLFGDSPALFPTDVPAAEAVRRLDAGLAKDPYMAGLDGKHVFGTVSSDRVRLQWVTPYVRNVFRPVFVGRLVETPSGATLVGTFRVLVIVKALACMSALLGAFTAVASLAQPTADLQLRATGFLLGCVFATAGFALVRITQFMAAGTRAQLSAFIASRLSDTTVDDGTNALLRERS
ncbi:MAG: hypothetical protein ABWX83_01590 [Luteibacter sp.]